MDDDDDDVNKSSDSVCTSEEYEIVGDSEPKLFISGDGGLEQLEMSMQEILCDEAAIAADRPQDPENVLSVEEMENLDCVSLSGVHVETTESEIAIFTKKHCMPSLDSKHSMYTLSPSPTEEDLMSISACLDYNDYIVFDGLIYFGSDVVMNSTPEADIRKNMAAMNDPYSQLKHLSLSILINAEGNVILYEQSSCSEITSFPVQQIKSYVQGSTDSREANFLSLVQEREDCASENVFVCHHFKCEGPEAASKIIQCLNTSAKRVPKLPVSKSNSCESVQQAILAAEPVKDNFRAFVFEASLEFKEEDGKGSFTSCPKDKDYFKLRCKLEKTVIVNVKQVLEDQELPIERCFGLLISPGRNVRNSDMQLVEMVSFCKSSFTEKSSYCVTGSWDPNEPVFEILNKETPKDTRVYLTVAVDLVIAGIQEPVRFVIETKAKLLPQNERFWYITKKTLQEHFYLNLRQVDGNEHMFQVVSLDSSSRIQRKKEALRLNLTKSGSKSSPPSTSSPPDPESESDNDEPLLSGTGDVSKDCTETELEGWSEVLLKWRLNLSQRPRHLSSLVKRGVPEALRGEVWQLLAGCHDHREFVDAYKCLINKDCPCESVILRDIHRTFPAHDLFKEKGGIGQEALFKICKAYSIYDPDVEYCQGLSFLVAALLLHMPEEQAFGVLVKIMFDYRVRDMFKNSFEELHLRFFQLQRLIEDQMPELFGHFQDLGIEVHMFASQWFLTLFTAKFPLIVVFFIIDLFLLDSIDVIFQVAVALLMLSKKELLALDFEGILKHFRVSLPKKYRSEESARQLIQTAIKVKVKKLNKYKKEYNTVKEEKLREDPLLSLQKENKRLQESNIHLDQENDDLAYELLNTKLQLCEERHQIQEKAENLSKELATTRASLSEVEEVKRRLEIEVAQLKEMCRRELQRAENENVRNSTIISEYKQICSQLSCRLEREQICSKQSIETLKAKMISCSQCSKFLESLQTSNPSSPIVNLPKGEMLSQLPAMNLQSSELELELAQTKLALVEAECKNQDLNHQLNIAISELQSSKNTWFQKTLSSIRDAGKKEVSTNRENKDSL